MKKVLIICYYWPPAGGPGVQRWLKFVKYLPDFGIKPIVYIPENPFYPLQDKSLVNQVSKDLEVIKYPIWEPYAWAGKLSKQNTNEISSGIIEEKEKQSWVQKAMLFIRGNLFIPDARKFWVKPSVKFLNNFLTTNSIDAVVTTGPPHSLHLIGLSLKAKKNIPWVADFRDPWTSIGYHDKLKLTVASQQKHKKLEKEVLTKTDQLIVTSPKTKKEFAHLTNTPIQVITNGFEPVSLPEVETSKSFSLVHIGSLLSERNPQLLWEVLRELRDENDAFAKALSLKLIGKVGASVLRSIKAQGLEESLDLMGYVPHKQALVEQRAAQVLLIIEINSKETQAIIPGKVFEYLGARRPIVAIGPSQSDFFRIIDDSNAGSCFTYNQKAALKAHIVKLFNSYQAGELNTTTGDIKQYTRKNLTARLANVLHELTDK